MKVAFVASEAVPFCKTGGLADVVGALTKELAVEKHRVVLVLPYYRQVKSSALSVPGSAFSISVWLNGQDHKFAVLPHTTSEKVQVYFVQYDRYFERSGLYGEPGGASYGDNHVRFAFLCRAALEIFKKVRFKPDVIHCHDWQTGLLPAYLKHAYREDPFFANTASLFTIHNMAYQGNFHRGVMGSLGLPEHAYQPEGVEFYGEVNFLKAGLYYSDGLSTVSHTYAHEIMSQAEYGRGFEGLLYTRRNHFRGIINGIDTAIWNPHKDLHLANNFDTTSLVHRVLCKKELQEYAGFYVNEEIPLLGFVGRIDYQKGIDMLVDTAPGFAQLGCQMVFLGVGDAYYRSGLESLQYVYPRQVFVESGFAEPTAHKIYGGVDCFLMPSRYEPCGLGQMIAMRYGAVPVVTPTGGLMDTVEPVDEHGNGTGFVAAQKNSHFFYLAVEEAVRTFKDKLKWRRLQKQAMRKDFSWEMSVAQYLKLYKELRHWKHERAL